MSIFPLFCRIDSLQHLRLVFCVWVSWSDITSCGLDDYERNWFGLLYRFWCCVLSIAQRGSEKRSCEVFTTGLLLPEYLLFWYQGGQGPCHIR